MEKKWKRGDVNPQTGKIFWSYNKGFKDHEWWIPVEIFDQRLAEKRERNRIYSAKRRAERPEEMKAKLNEWRKKNEAHYREYSRKNSSEWVKKNKERHAENGKRWLANNPEKAKAMRRSSHERRTEKIAAYRKDYARRFPEKVNTKTALRRARVKGAIHPSHRKEIEVVLRRQAKRLSEMLGVKFEVDHIVPIAQGGPHYHLNLLVLPMRWNRRKSKGSLSSIPSCWHPVSLDKIRLDH